MTTPTLGVRLDEVEANLAATRASRVEAYGHWTRALDDLENAWALAVSRSANEGRVRDPCDSPPKGDGA